MRSCGSHFETARQLATANNDALFWLTVMHTIRDSNFESFSITDDRIADSLPDALLENDKTTSMISFKICDCLEGQGGTMPGMCAMFGAPSGVGHSGLPRDHSRYLRSGSNSVSTLAQSSPLLEKA